MLNEKVQYKRWWHDGFPFFARVKMFTADGVGSLKKQMSTADGVGSLKKHATREGFGSKWS